MQTADETGRRRHWTDAPRRTIPRRCHTNTRPHRDTDTVDYTQTQTMVDTNTADVTQRMTHTMKHRDGPARPNAMPYQNTHTRTHTLDGNTKTDQPGPRDDGTPAQRHRQRVTQRMTHPHTFDRQTHRDAQTCPSRYDQLVPQLVQITDQKWFRS